MNEREFEQVKRRFNSGLHLVIESKGGRYRVIRVVDIRPGSMRYFECSDGSKIAPNFVDKVIECNSVSEIQDALNGE